MNRDLQSRTAIVIKGGLFLFIGLFASALLLIEHWSWRTALLLTLALWASAAFTSSPFRPLLERMVILIRRAQRPQWQGSRAVRY